MPWRLARGARALIGMVHLGPLPGTPRWGKDGRGAAGGGISRLAMQAAAEAAILARAGFDGVLIENMHDAPYVMGPQDPIVVGAMTACALAVQEVLDDFRRPGRALPLGVQVLAGANEEALAVAMASGAAFIRAENFVFAHVADEGLMARASAGPLLRVRRSIGAEHVAIWADIKKKHAAHAVSADVSLAETAAAAGFFGADALVVTGRATGRPTDPDDVSDARRGTDEAGDRKPIVVGSGVTAATVRGLLERADALIVGSAIKRGGSWRNPIDEGRAAAIVAARDGQAEAARAKRGI
ncbi:MAG: BtpA/SgcQ family protein [Phycisphaerales bacterium]